MSTELALRSQSNQAPADVDWLSILESIACNLSGQERTNWMDSVHGLVTADETWTWATNLHGCLAVKVDLGLPRHRMSSMVASWIERSPRKLWQTSTVSKLLDMTHIVPVAPRAPKCHECRGVGKLEDGALCDWCEATGIRDGRTVDGEVFRCTIIGSGCGSRYLLHRWQKVVDPWFLWRLLRNVPDGPVEVRGKEDSTEQLQIWGDGWVAFLMPMKV